MKHPIFLLAFLSFAPLFSAEFYQDSVWYHYPAVGMTANRYEKDVFETHLPAITIREQSIWQTGLSSLAEVVDGEPGMAVVSSGPWSQKFVVRGLTEAHVLTLVDGMRLDVLRDYGSHAPLVDVDQIERIEVIRGPGSVLYGSNAIAGVVNIITKSPGSSGHELIRSEVGLQYSSVNKQTNESLGLQGQSGVITWGLQLNHREADNIQTPDGKLSNTAFSGYESDAKIAWKPASNQTLILNGHITRMDKVGVPTSPYAQKAEFKTYNRDRIALTYELQSTSKWLNAVKTNAYFQKGERNFDAYLYHVPKGALFVNNRLNANRKVNTAGGSAQAGMIFGSHLILYGADVFTETDDTERLADAAVVNALDQVMKDPPADLTPPTPKSDRSGIGVFMENENQLSQRFNLNVGLRYDYIASHADGTPGTLVTSDTDETDTDFSGSVGVVYKASQNIRILANVGRAFKAPTLQERFFKGTAQVGYLSGNPDLNSETSFNMDAGVRWQTGRIEAGVYAFRNQINDFIVMKPITAAADTFLYDNVGKALLQGAELELRVILTRHLSSSAQLGFVRGKDTELNEDLPQVPPLNGKLSLRFDGTAGKYWMEATGQFADKQDKVAENEKETAGYGLLHLSAGVNVGSVVPGFKKCYLTGNVRNVFDKAYRDHLSTVSWWVAPGRNVVIGLRGEL